jgi:rhodanese-related sulfurtransferase
MGNLISGSSNMHHSVQRMTPKYFHEVLKSPERANYQIIDVREKSELASASLSGNDVLNLPLSQLNSWSKEFVASGVLDVTKPTICMCHHGMRSMKVANYLGKTLEFV